MASGAHKAITQGEEKRIRQHSVQGTLRKCNSDASARVAHVDDERWNLELRYIAYITIESLACKTCLRIDMTENLLCSYPLYTWQQLG